MLKKLLFVAVICISISSCATARVQKTLNSWIGMPEDKLIMQWGMPHRSMDSNGTKIHEYRYCSVGGVTYPIGQMAVTNFNTNCDRWTFYIKEGVVSSDRYDPN